MSICTKTGDKGTTSLYTGERVPKNSQRVNAYGTVDEVSSALGLARAFAKNAETAQVMLKLEQINMSVMADLASIVKDDSAYYITKETIDDIEDDIKDFESRLPPMRSFIMPGRSKAGAFLDLARTVTRRAEREVLTLAETEKVNDNVRIYLNRLSDLVFLLMRIEDGDAKQ